MSNKIGAKIVLEGEAEYRKAIKNINTEQKELRSEMRLCTSQFAGQQNSIAALTKKGEILSKQYDAQARKVEIYSKAVEDAAKRQEEAGDKVDALKSELEEANKKMEEMSSSTDTSSEALEEQQKVIEELKNKLALAEDGYSRAQMVTNNWQTSLNNAQADLNGLSHEIQNNDRYLAEAQNSMDGCADSIDEYGNEVEEAQEQTSTFADVLKADLLSGAIKDGLKAIAEGIKNIATAAVETGSNFEASMSQVAATMGITVDEIANGSASYELLSKAAQDCGKSTMFSASQSAEALNYLALAGYDAQKAAATLPKVLNLAAAGGLDLAYASDLVTDSMAALGLETEQLDTYIDEMARTSQKSNTSVSQLGEATLVCAGTVSLTGQSLETMNTSLGVLANNGLKGAEGGTHLRNVLLSLSAPMDKGAAAMKELGLQVYDSQGKMRDLNDILTDLNRLTSDMSQEEKTQLIRKIFKQTDISAVNALLKSTNGEYKTLNGNIKDCSGAAQAMADTLNNNLKGKVTILQSALEGLGITAYDLFDDSMKEAVESATDAVGRLQSEIDNGALGVSLSNMAEALGDFAQNAIGVAEDALPVLIDGLTWLLENSDLVISGIIGIVTANMQMNVVGPAINAVAAAWNAYKTANEGATISQWLLNTAMNANPAGIIITAIVGLTAAVSAYALMNKDSAKNLDEVTKSTREQVKAAKDLNDQYKQGVSDRAQKRSDMEAEVTACQKLVTELENLQNKTSLTAEEEQRQKMIIDELNGVMPELNLQIDEQTGLLNMSTEELEKNVDAMMALARAEAAREDLTQIAKDQYEAEKQLADLEEQLIQQKEAVAETQKKVNEENEKYSDNLEMQMASTGGYCDLLYQQQAAQKELEDQIASTKESISGFTDEYSTTMEYISNTEQIYNSEAAIEDLGDAAEGTGDDITAMSQDAIDAYNDMYDELSETIENQMNLFDKFSGKAELSTSDILTNMQSQVDGISNWADNLDTLADRGINQGLLKYLADMGPQGAGYVATFVSMTDAELEKANELFEKSLLIPDSAASEIVDSYTQIGQNSTKGYTQGVESGIDEAVAASEGLGDETSDALADELEEESPSKRTRRIGEFFTEGFREGIDEHKDTLTTSGKTLGSQTVEGLKSGIESGKSKVIESIKSLCTRVIQTAKNALGIHSPSKEFEYLGDMSVEGYRNAVTEGMDECAEAVHEAMDAVMDYDCEGVSEGQAEAAEAVKNLTEALVEQGKVSAESGTAIIDYIDGNTQLGDSADETVEKIKQLQEAYGKAKEEALDSIDSQVGLFEKLEMKSDVSTKDMIESLRSQTAYLNTYSADLTMAAELARQGLLDEGLLGAIREMGLNGAGYLHELVNTSQKDMASFQTVMNEWAAMSQVKENLSNTMAGLEVIYGDKLDDIAEVQKSKGKEVESQATSTATSTKKTASDTLDEMVSVTSDGITNMTDMVSEKASDVEDSVVKLCTTAIDGFKATLDIDSTGKSRKFASIGYSIPQGIAEGINDGQDIVTNAVRNVINNAISSIDFDGLSDTIVNKINKELGGLVD